MKSTHLKTNNHFKSSIIVLLLVLLIFTPVCFFFSQQKVAYVLIEELYEEFEFKKQLNSQLNLIQNQHKSVLDSLEVAIKMQEKKLQIETSNKKEVEGSYYYLIEVYETKHEQFKNEEDRLSGIYNGQIINQINKYVKEYGEKNNFSIIYGTEGQGNIMYARDKFNITKEILKYINHRHAGN